MVNRAYPVSLVMLLAVLFAALPASAQKVSSESASYEGLAKGNNAFAVQVYGELAGKAGNIFFSPCGISMALGMTYAGARGDTAKEIKRALDFQFDQTRLNEAFKSYNRELMDSVDRSGQKLRIANALCLTRGNVSKPYKDILRKFYDAEVFSGGLNPINRWVKRKTEGKIPNILKELNPNSVCVILNAIYFNGTWKTRFSKKRTREAPFAVSSTKQATVPLMYRRGNFKMLVEKGFKAVSIPYAGGDLSMVVLLPDAPSGLGGLEKQLGAASLGKWLSGLDKQHDRKIDLYLPKFTLDTGYNLKPLCMRMGMRSAFSRNADFSAMGGRKGDLWISQIQHKVFLKVNERGTEAAAATAVEIVTKSMPSYPQFRADHPFIFLVRDDRTGMILFMGRMSDPTAK
ncbi:MAG: serpin family protein [Syntrophobacteraceae bacterium]